MWRCSSRISEQLDVTMKLLSACLLWWTTKTLHRWRGRHDTSCGWISVTLFRNILPTSSPSTSSRSFAAGFASFLTKSADSGFLWGDHFIRLGQFEKARDVYEEAMASVTTVHDFSLIYGAYSKFLESLLTASMERDADAGNDRQPQCQTRVNLVLCFFAVLWVDCAQETVFWRLTCSCFVWKTFSRGVQS